METLSRNYTIDKVRLLASFFVVTLHVSLTLSNETTVAFIMLSCRWAVPFFFMITGYLYQSRFEKDPQQALKKNCLRLIRIFLFSIIIYWPLAYLRNHVLFKFHYLYNGTFYHLWFLSSMVGGLIVLYFLSWLRLPDKVILLICILLLLYVLFKDSYSNLLYSSGKTIYSYSHSRWPLSIPFLFLGMYIRKKKDDLKPYINWPTGLGLIVAGLMLQLCEAYFLNILTGYAMERHEFLIGTLVTALGVFISVLAIPSTESKFSRWGESYSLLIYLYHPLVDALVATILKFYEIQLSLSFIFPIVVFALTLLLVMLIKRYIPVMFSVLCGSYILFNERSLSGIKHSRRI